jgi:PIN domain nuclease of toxin-antitoxin system
VKLLLDTQCWLWIQVAPERFSAQALALIRDDTNVLVLSAASCWEIAIKYALGKLPLPAPPEQYVPDRMQSSGVDALPVRMEHALRVANLPPHHRDPFDRVLVAQAQIERLPLLTADAQLALYDVDLLPAR